MLLMKFSGEYQPKTLEQQILRHKYKDNYARADVHMYTCTNAKNMHANTQMQVQLNNAMCGAEINCCHTYHEKDYQDMHD